jgi:hypothetical protein
MPDFHSTIFSSAAPSFLSGGGEMGELIRSKDWSGTSLGEPVTWPQSLRTTIGIVLNSKFPMFLFWGPQLLCFYNDAYRPSLGINGKHPAIVGMPGEKAWAEIWTIIKTFIDEVLQEGKVVWREDQLIPIYRNGTIEDVYWTFSYSPVNDESEKPGGVLVICSETTEKITGQKIAANLLTETEHTTKAQKKFIGYAGTGWYYSTAEAGFYSRNGQ